MLYCDFQKGQITQSQMEYSASVNALGHDTNNEWREYRSRHLPRPCWCPCPSTIRHSERLPCTVFNDTMSSHRVSLYIILFLLSELPFQVTSPPRPAQQLFCKSFLLSSRFVSFAISTTISCLDAESPSPTIIFLEAF